MTKLRTVTSVADILERELLPTIKEWLRRVNLVPGLTNISTQRCGSHRASAQAVPRPNLPPAPCSGRRVAHLRRRRRARTGTECAGLLCQNAHSRVADIPGRDIQHTTPPSGRTRSEPGTFRRNGHRGRGGCTTHGNREQLDGSESSCDRSLAQFRNRLS